MENIEKITRFEEAIKTESEAEISAVLSAAEARAKEAVASVDEEYLEKSYKLVSKETKNIKDKYEKLISQKGFEASKKVFAHRNEVIEVFFAEIAKEIADYSKTADYQQDLAKILSDIEKQNSFDDRTVAYVKPEDVDTVKKLYPKLKIEADKKIKLGGVTVYYPQNSMYVDKTYDNAFEQQRADFVNNEFMQLN